jgi:predicted Zn finger-like uncharacterized protein
MRLVCPNCEAKYEVPEDAIPETGRDVQCANCGHAWFQMRSRAAMAEPATAPPAPVVEPEPVAEPVAVAAVQETPPVVEPTAEPEGAVIAEAAPDPDAGEDSVAAGADAVVLDGEGEAGVAEVAPLAEDLAETVAAETMADDPVVDAPAVDEEIAEVTAVEAVADAVVAEGAQAAETEASAAAAMAAPAAYAVDESVLAILREEAEREVQARRAEGARPLETQTDLGIDAAIPVAKVAETVAAPVETEADDKLANRRTRLPDVEEINSTLRPTETADERRRVRRRPCPGRGSQQLPQRVSHGADHGDPGIGTVWQRRRAGPGVPALAGPLKAYVGFVDSLRLHLDGLMQSATVAINGD